MCSEENPSRAAKTVLRVPGLIGLRYRASATSRKPVSHGLPGRAVESSTPFLPQSLHEPCSYRSFSLVRWGTPRDRCRRHEEKPANRPGAHIVRRRQEHKEASASPQRAAHSTPQHHPDKRRGAYDGRTVWTSRPAHIIVAGNAGGKVLWRLRRSYSGRAAPCSECDRAPAHGRGDRSRSRGHQRAPPRF